MQLEKPTSFRPPHDQFVTLFNHALNATGLSANDLCIASIEMGLPLAVQKILEAKRQAEAGRQFAEREFLRLIDVSWVASAVLAEAVCVAQKQAASSPNGKALRPKGAAPQGLSAPLSG